MSQPLEDPSSELSSINARPAASSVAPGSAETPEPPSKAGSTAASGNPGSLRARRSLDATEPPKPPPMLASNAPRKTKPSLSASKGRAADRATASPPAVPKGDVANESAKPSAPSSSGEASPKKRKAVATGSQSDQVGSSTAASQADAAKKRDAAPSDEATADKAAQSSKAKRRLVATSTTAAAAAAAAAAAEPHRAARKPSSDGAADGRAEKRAKTVHFAQSDSASTLGAAGAGTTASTPASSSASSDGNDNAFAHHARVLRAVPAALDFMFDRIKRLESQVATLEAREANVKDNAQAYVKDQLGQFAAMSAALHELQTRVCGDGMFGGSESA